MRVREKGRGRRCGELPYLPWAAQTRGKSHCWRPEELGRSLVCECGMGWRHLGETGGPWPWTLSAGGALGQGYSWESGEAAQRQGRAEIGQGDGDDLSVFANVHAAAWGKTCGWGLLQVELVPFPWVSAVPPQPGGRGRQSGCLWDPTPPIGPLRPWLAERSGSVEKEIGRASCRERVSSPV